MVADREATKWNLSRIPNKSETPWRTGISSHSSHRFLTQTVGHSGGTNSNSPAYFRATVTFVTFPPELPTSPTKVEGGTLLPADSFLTKFTTYLDWFQPVSATIETGKMSKHSTCSALSGLANLKEQDEPPTINIPIFQVSNIR